jgi:hypothetical protein
MVVSSCLGPSLSPFRYRRRPSSYDERRNGCTALFGPVHGPRDNVPSLGKAQVQCSQPRPAVLRPVSAPPPPLPLRCVRARAATQARPCCTLAARKLTLSPGHGPSHGDVTHAGVTLHPAASWHKNAATGMSAIMWCVPE